MVLLGARVGASCFVKDQVVLPIQTQRMADVLRRKNIPVEVYTFSEEGHGFRDGRVKIMVLESMEQFFAKNLEF